MSPVRETVYGYSGFEPVHHTRLLGP